MASILLHRVAQRGQGQPLHWGCSTRSSSSGGWGRGGGTTSGSGRMSTGCMACSRHGAVSARVCSSSHATPRAGTCCPQRVHCTCAQWMVPLWEHDTPLKPAFIGALGAHAREKEAAAQLRVCTAPLRANIGRPGAAPAATAHAGAAGWTAADENEWHALLKCDRLAHL